MTAARDRPHPVDSAGLVLPEPSWPDEPGSAGLLEPLRRFCNTVNRENGADAWRTPRELEQWLAGEGHDGGGSIDSAALARLVTLRDALWHGVSTDDFGPFARAAGVLAVGVEATGRHVALAPAGSGVDAVVARLALTVSHAATAGVLDRLKSCGHCRWVFHDTSKNRSGRWCSMTACGGRSKARAYRSRRAGLAPAVLAVVGLLAGAAGCADDDDDDADEVTELAGLTATLEQYREDEIQGFISVKTSNQSSSTVEFRNLRLQWPGIAETEPRVRSTQLAPGVTFDIRVIEGDAECGDPSAATASPPPDAAVAIGSASIDGAAPVLVAVPVDDERSILPKVYRRSCQEQRQTWAAALRFGDDWTPTVTPAGKPALLGAIELSRNQSDEPLTITEINGSVLLRITAASSDPVVTLDAGDDATTVPIVVEQSGNCSPHALIESKKTFIIPIGFAVGDDEPSAYVITFDTPARDVLNQMINESCGLAP